MPFTVPRAFASFICAAAYTDRIGSDPTPERRQHPRYRPVRRAGHRGQRTRAFGAGAAANSSRSRSARTGRPRPIAPGRSGPASGMSSSARTRSAPAASTTGSTSGSTGTCRQLRSRPLPSPSPPRPNRAAPPRRAGSAATSIATPATPMATPGRGGSGGGGGGGARLPRDHRPQRASCPRPAAGRERVAALVPGVEVTTYGGHWNAWGGRRWYDFREPDGAKVGSIMRQAAAEAPSSA